MAAPFLGQEHLDRTKYLRYHRDIYIPEGIREAVTEFLPPPFQPLSLSKHYLGIMDERHLPKQVHMPSTYTVIDVTVVRETLAIFRVALRFHWSRSDVPRRKQSDLVITLEGDYEVVTGFWLNPRDHKPELITDVYEPAPITETERRLLNELEGAL